MTWRVVALLSFAACGRFGFDASTDSAENDAFEQAREDGGVDRVCTAPLAVTQVIVGRAHVCAFTGTNRVYCWGANEHGQLGLGDFSPRAIPTLQAGTNITSLVPSIGDHSCLFAGVGNLVCWGANADGQLGLTPTTDQPTPSLVGGGWGAVAAGDHHTCGYKANEVYCWGANDRGQLGLGDRISRSTPTMLANQQWTGPLFMGHRYACAEASLGIPIGLRCWGANDLGHSDLPDVSDKTTPGAGVCCNHVPSIGGGHVISRHSGPSMMVWGANEHGQLGLGDNADHGTAIVNGPGMWGALATGEAHSCGIETTTRVLRCWGQNERGQLGIGAAGPDELAPVQVGTDTDWQAVVAGGRETCAIKLDGRLYCWGANDSGQLGIGHTVQRSSPVQVCVGE